jgi:nucleotide-binding universal stress UspA family protein
VPLEAHLVLGDPVSRIVDYVGEHGFDLLVIGFVSHSAAYHRLIGSIADRLVEHTPCAVLVIK